MGRIYSLLFITRIPGQRYYIQEIFTEHLLVPGPRDGIMEGTDTISAVSGRERLVK